MRYAYKVGGRQVSLQLAEDRLAVRFKDSLSRADRLSVAAARPEIGDPKQRFEVPSEKFTVLNVASGRARTAERFDAAVAAMETESSVECCSPVFVAGEAFVFAPNRLMVGFVSRKGARKMLKAYGCEVMDRVGKEYLVSIDPGADPFQIAAALDDLVEVEYAEPDFVSFGTYLDQAASGFAPLDPTAADRYAMRITKAEDAWALELADPNIKVAVLDVGVDATHVDLASAIVDKYDGVEDDGFQQPNPWDSHGTACAGLAVAVHDNDTAMKGVAGGCSLMAARIAHSKTPGNRKTSDSWIARGIDWAWKNGADVLSNSWTTTESSAITNAIKRARTKGRNGRGCVVVVAAGNSDGPCGYPASLADVLTVSASNQFDEPKTPTSRDGDTGWGSSFGPRVDVAAPGILNFTTDIMGEAGFNPAPPPAGNYNPRFRGTSSSAPIVAGAAALVLSANPDLTEAEVSALIRNTADKVGGIAYDDGRNDRMGHGRVNVLRAVRAAQEGRIDGEPVEGPVEDPDEEPVVEPVDEPAAEPVEGPAEGPIEIPTGRHAPVSNIDGDREREARVLLSYPSRSGEAGSELQKTRKGAEWLPSVNPPTVPDTFQAPDTSGLRNIAEASYGPPALAGESVQVPDRRVKIDGPEGYPWRAHASLVITARDGSRWLGTGWFVGPRTLVTAGHAVYVKNSAAPALDGWVSRIDVMPGRNGSELPYGSVRSEVFHTVAGWAEDGDHRYDYGAITIPTELGETVGTLGFGVFNGEDLHRVIGNIAGYSSDKPDGTQWYENNRVEHVSARKVYYDMDLVGDHSGSAVYRIDADGHRQAFGIHAHGGRRNNAAIRITVPVYHNFRHWMQAYG